MINEANYYFIRIFHFIYLFKLQKYELKYLKIVFMK